MMIQATQTQNVIVDITPTELFRAVDKFLRLKQNIPLDGWISNGDIMEEGRGGSHGWDENVRRATDEDVELMKLLETLKECLV